MVLSSHNSMTYLEPKHWFMKLFKSIYQCQTKTIPEQYNAGVRYFDIRISFDKKDQPEFRHGLVAFDGQVIGALNWLNKQNDDIVVRMVLEKSNGEDDNCLFRELCKFYQQVFKNILFVCGEDKHTKEVIYDFDTFCYLRTEEHYSSVRGKWFQRIFPGLYAKKHNNSLINKYKNEDCYLMIDFV